MGYPSTEEIAGKAIRTGFSADFGRSERRFELVAQRSPDFGIASANDPGSSERRVRLAIGGMTCASCVRAVERAITSVPGVVDAAVNLATGDARVTLSSADGDPGISPRLAAAVERAGYTARVTAAGEVEADLSAEESAAARRRFLLALAGTAPVAAAMWGLGPTPLSIAIQGGFAFLVLAGPGGSFFLSATRALARLHTTMDTLIALGAGTSFLASIAALFGWLGAGAPLFFETSAFLITFISLGKWLEARARGEARAALRSLLDLSPPTARRIENGEERTVPAAELTPGDRIVVLPGERIPADGVVRRGTTAVDESLLTGESVPVDKKSWDEVTGGSLNESGRIEVEVTAAGQRTVLSGIVRMVREAQAEPAPIQRLADRVSGVFVPVVIVLAIATLVTWLALGAEPARAIGFAVAVVVIACPCALGLATPTAILAGSGLGLRHGILVKNGGALESLARATVLLLDKTGTVTEGRFSLVAVETAGAFDEDRLLATAAALERGSSHPIARAVVAAAVARGLTVPALETVEEARGLGLAGRVAGIAVRVGRREFLVEDGVAVTADSDRQTTRVHVAIDGAFAGVLHFADSPRAEAKEVIAELRADGLEPILLTGDRRGPAEEIARAVGIARVEAEVRPGEKQDRVRAAQAGGAVVAMVGDGINDAPALAAADAGIAIGAGADAAKESGGLVLVRSDLRDLVRARRLARATLAKIRQNLGWAFVYNLLGLPIAGGAFATLGVVLRPEYAGLAMALSSVSVVGNSLLLRRREGTIFS